MKPLGTWWVYLAAAIAAAGVVIHVGAVFGGPSWFAYFNAPPAVVASARDGTWLAPASALIIAGLMAVCALYAGSAVRLVRRPPFQRLGLACIAAVCLLRALILPPLAIGHPELRNTFEVVSALIWLAAGVGFAVGFRVAKPGSGRHGRHARAATVDVLSGVAAGGGGCDARPQPVVGNRGRAASAGQVSSAG